MGGRKIFWVLEWLLPVGPSTDLRVKNIAASIISKDRE